MAESTQQPLLAANNADEEHDDDSSSSSSSEDESDDEGEAVGKVDAAPTINSEARAKWKMAGKAVVDVIRVPLLLGHAMDDVRATNKRKRKRNKAMIFAMLVFLAVMDTETKATAFHLSAVGMYSIDGKPYQFSYSLFVALAVFIMKLCLGPLERAHHEKEKKEKKELKKNEKGDKARSERAGTTSSNQTETSPQSKEMEAGGGGSPAKSRRQSKSKRIHVRILARLSAMVDASNLRDKLMPWILLFSFTFC
jgi:hypothetical protein